MNDYDKAGRYLTKRGSEGSLRWFLRNPRLVFRAWSDARRVALPKQHELTSDLVAAVEIDGVLEAICLELEVEARSDAGYSLASYVVPSRMKMARHWWPV